MSCTPKPSPTLASLESRLCQPAQTLSASTRQPHVAGGLGNRRTRSTDHQARRRPFQISLPKRMLAHSHSKCLSSSDRIIPG